MKEIRKRNGEIVPFEDQKIFDAVWKAAVRGVSRSEGEARNIAEDIRKKAVDYLRIFFSEGNNIPTVEQVQDLVEKLLIEGNYVDVAKAYILYREQHSRIRDTERMLREGKNLISRYLDRLDWKIKENSNMSYSLQGLNNYISSDITASYWLNEIYPQRVREAHSSGDLHIHDLSLLAVYCCGWDLQDLLMNGFTGVKTKTCARPPKHFRAALGQMANFLYTMQGEAAGAQAFSNFDTLLAPFVAYDNLSYRNVKQALQEFVFNLNVPTRVGFQTPFTNITMDLSVPSALGKLPAIIGGDPIDKTYGDFQSEMDMINRAFAEIMLEGDAGGKLFPFPIPTYNITKDFDWDNKVLAPVWEMTAKYGIPYFSNFVNSDMDPDDVRSMCCRLRLDNAVLRKRGGGLFGSNPMTGSIGVVTLNMPRIGHLSRTEEEFIERTFTLMEIAKESLEIKRKVLERLTEANLYPYSKFYLRNIKETSGYYWNNHFNTIGLNGMNEAVRNFLGTDLTTQEGIAFATRIMEAMREKLLEFQEGTEHLYNLEATPAEGTSSRFARIDRDLFGDDIVCANHEACLERNAEP